jgi:hypothetical protein
LGFLSILLGKAHILSLVCSLKWCRYFFCDQRLTRPKKPLLGVRSISPVLKSRPSGVARAFLRQGTFSGHSKHPGGTALKPLAASGKTRSKIPKHAFGVIEKPALKKAHQSLQAYIIFASQDKAQMFF